MQEMIYFPKNLEERLQVYRSCPDLRVIRSNLKYPITKESFKKLNFKLKGDFYQPEGIGSKQGFFYEILSQGIWGGELNPKINLNLGASEISFFPDLSSKEYISEIKSISPYRRLKLKDWQIAKYSAVIYNDQFPEKRINFKIFRHGLKEIQKKYGNKKLRDLIKGLSQNTFYGISMPFSLIFELYSSNFEHTSRYDNDGSSFETQTRVSSKFIDELVCEPENTLKSLGFQKDRFGFIPRNSPKRIKVNRFEVRSFPFLEIVDREIDSWRSNFSREMDKNIISLPSNFSRNFESFCESGDLMLDLKNEEKELPEKEIEDPPF